MATEGKPVKEIPVIQDQGLFTHDTGDTYEGYFEAKKKDHSVKMHGPGVYTTAEGDTYTGVWEADKLGHSEVAVISYVDGSRYEGSFRDWQYNGEGKYIFPDGSKLECEFLENCPSGLLVLTDPNEHDWIASAEHGYAWFEPVNHYYECLEKDYHKKRRKNLADENSGSRLSNAKSFSKTSKLSPSPLSKQPLEVKSPPKIVKSKLKNEEK